MLFCFFTLPQNKCPVHMNLKSASDVRCHPERLILTWLVSFSPSAAWMCWFCLSVHLDADFLLSLILWGVTLPALLLELDCLCSPLLLGDPAPRPLAWLSCALISSFCLVSWAISASMTSGESCELRGSEVSDSEEVEGRLVRGRLVRLEAELWIFRSSQERRILTAGSSWCSGKGWVTVEEEEEQKIKQTKWGWHEHMTEIRY